MKLDKKPLQIYMTKNEFMLLEDIRKTLGFRSWADTIRYLIDNYHSQ